MRTLSFQLAPGDSYAVELARPARVLLLAGGPIAVSHKGDGYQYDASAHITSADYPFALPGPVSGIFYVYNSPAASETIGCSVIIVEV